MAQGLYGRKYELLVLTPANDNSGGQDTLLTLSSSSFEPSALQIVFDVHTPCISSPYWYATIDIYNTNSPTAFNIVQTVSSIEQGSIVKLSAGYQGGQQYGLIWQGPVFQALYVRENVTDFKLTLNCILSLESAISGNPLVNAPYSSGWTDEEILLKTIQQLGIQKDYISPSLSQSKRTRGGALFGPPADILNKIAIKNNMVYFLSERGLSMGKLNENVTDKTPTTPGFVYTPQTGLIGTPQQTQAGVSFSVFLDPRIRAQMPLQTVGIDQAYIQNYKRQIGEPILPLDQSGTYAVGDVHHRGDTRGNLWQTDITGYYQSGNALALLGPSSNANVNR